MKIERAIYEPLFGPNGYLFQLVRTWMRNGKQDLSDWWFPDGLLFMTNSQYRPSSTGPNFKNEPVLGAAARQIEADLRTLWTTGPHGQGFANILDNPGRFGWRGMPPAQSALAFNQGTWSARHGFAVTWEPTDKQ